MSKRRKVIMNKNRNEEKEEIIKKKEGAKSTVSCPINKNEKNIKPIADAAADLTEGAVSSANFIAYCNINSTWMGT